MRAVFVLYTPEMHVLFLVSCKIHSAILTALVICELVCYRLRVLYEVPVLLSRSLL